MPRYIINKNAQPNGDYEVHNATTGCTHMPLPENQIELGNHLSCTGAVQFAKEKLPSNRINGCYFCCNNCHTS